MKRALSLAAIGLGGMIGASVRWGVNELVPESSFPWATFLVNVVGCGLLAGVDWSALRQDVRMAAGTGFCGGLTTFSTFAVEAVTLADDGRTGVAALYVGASVAVGLGTYVVVRSWMVGMAESTA